MAGSVKKDHGNILNNPRYLAESQFFIDSHLDPDVTRKIDEYAKQAKATWGTTDAYKEYEQKSKDWTKADRADIHKQMMDIFREFGQIRESDPESPEAQALVKKLQDFITKKMYTSTNDILSGLGQMYGVGGSLTTNIDGVGGEGTAQFVCDAIQIYCG